MNRLLASTRPFRFELFALVSIGAVIVVAAGGVALRLLSFGVPRSCFASPDVACVPYARAMADYLAAANSWAQPAMITAAILPVLAAILIGVGLVGKEIDQRTTVLAWSLAPSRSRWLVQRLIPMGFLLVILCLVAGGLADLLMGLQRPTLDQAHNFDGLGARGLPLVGSGILVLGLSLLVGAVLGRILPSILVGGAFAVCAFLLISFGHDALLRSESVVVESLAVEEGARTMDGLVRTPEGEVISWEVAYERYGDALGQLMYDPFLEGSTSGFTEMTRLVHAAEYPMASARLALIESAVGVLVIGLGFMVVQRRRP